MFISGTCVQEQGRLGSAKHCFLLMISRHWQWKLRFAMLTMLAALAVFLVLLAGLWNMMRGTSPNLSQKLMRWRVGLQFLAIVIGMLLVYFWRT